MRSRRIDLLHFLNRQPALRQIVAGATIVLVGALGLAYASQPAYAIGTAVDLGTASSYSVLGGASVTNTGPTVLNADVGVGPGTAISGFPPGITSGATHATDAHALQAQSDLTIAYDAAAGQAPDASIADDLGGLSLPPGVYNASSSIQLTGPLTLDAAGDPNAVFVFQIGSALTTATSSSVVLIGGARSCNVFWQVGSSATLGTDTAFVGTILALTSITADTGATVDGRALARNGSVTLDTNTFTGGSCAAVPTTPPTGTPTTPPTVTPTTPATVPPTGTPTTPATVPPTDTATTPATVAPTGSLTPATDTTTPTLLPTTPTDTPLTDTPPTPPGGTLPGTGGSVSLLVILGAAGALLLGTILAVSGYRSSRRASR